MQLFHHNRTGGFLLLPECVKCDTSLLHSTPNVRKKERRGEEQRLIGRRAMGMSWRAASANWKTACVNTSRLPKERGLIELWVRKVYEGLSKI